MTIPFRARGNDPPELAKHPFPFDHWEPTGPSPYVTDGTNLYRYVGGVPFETGELVALEDCRSLKLLLFSLEELRALGLRAVEPAAREPVSRSE